MENQIFLTKDCTQKMIDFAWENNINMQMNENKNLVEKIISNNEKIPKLDRFVK